jgi:nitroimidazol reductase NimA-like FMN-containing flavoprotein (pyridoxamine 5'-phosphate oxidase superfamily)
MVDPVAVPLADPGSSDRTRIRRLPGKAATDREVAYAILDAGLVAHVCVLEGDQPFVLPVGYARRGDDVLIHGSSGSRLFRSLADGADTCLTVTLLDGLVLARSAFESSMHYRSVMVLGRARRLEGDDELDALRVLTEHLLPGRWSEARQPSRKERAATMTLALPLDEISVKVSAGDPDDDPDDLADPVYSAVWAGTVPIVSAFGEPRADQHTPAGTPVPDYVRGWSLR